MPRADQTALLRYRARRSGEQRAVLTTFESLVQPWLEWSAELVKASRRLAATRDLLLPRLVTGKLDISDIDLGVLTPAETE